LGASQSNTAVISSKRASRKLRFHPKGENQEAAWKRKNGTGWVSLVQCVCLRSYESYDGRKEEDVLKAKAEMASEVKVTIEQAFKAASKKVQRTVIEAELVKKQGKTIWKVEMVTTDGTVMGAIVDSETGAVTTVEKKKSEMECC
jgi:uncharacterized membrane protein YkoI